MPSRDQLTAARADLAVFAALIGVTLTDWQAGALRLTKRTTAVVAPRQTGKSRSLAVLALWWAYRRPGQVVLIISAGDEAAKRVLAEVRALAAASPLLAGSMVDETAALLRLSNGSEVRSVPASERQIRGQRVDLLIIDEAALVADDLILQAALPTTAARPHARVVLASSPNGRTGAFFTFATRGLEGDEHVSTFRRRLADASWITPATIRDLRAALPPERAAAELDGEFVDVTGDDFPLLLPAWVEAARGRSLVGGGQWSVGVDVARFGRDRSIAYARRGGRVRKLFEARGMDTVAVAGQVIGAMRDELQSPPEPAVVIVDDTGVGGGVTDQLRHRGVGVRAFIAAERAVRPDRFANVRAEAAWTLRMAFERGDVDLDPEDRDPAGQLAAARYSYDDKGRVLLGSKRRMSASPDHLDSVVMCFTGWQPVEQRFDRGELERRMLIARGRARMGVVEGAGFMSEEMLDRIAWASETRREARNERLRRSGRGHEVQEDGASPPWSDFERSVQGRSVEDEPIWRPM